MRAAPPRVCGTTRKIPRCRLKFDVGSHPAQFEATLTAFPTPTAMTRTSELDDTRRIVCERCGQEFGCARDRIIGCWCVGEPYRLPIPLPPEAGNFSDCLCPSCLRAIAEALAGSGNPRLPDEP